MTTTCQKCGESGDHRRYEFYVGTEVDVSQESMYTDIYGSFMTTTTSTYRVHGKDGAEICKSCLWKDWRAQKAMCALVIVGLVVIGLIVRYLYQFEGARFTLLILFVFVLLPMIGAALLFMLGSIVVFLQPYPSESDGVSLAQQVRVESLYNQYGERLTMWTQSEYDELMNPAEENG